MLMMRAARVLRQRLALLVVGVGVFESSLLARQIGEGH
jgi:hypothetical protein